MYNSSDSDSEFEQDEREFVLQLLDEVCERRRANFELLFQNPTHLSEEQAGLVYFIATRLVETMMILSAVYEDYDSLADLIAQSGAKFSEIPKLSWSAVYAVDRELAQQVSKIRDEPVIMDTAQIMPPEEYQAEYPEALAEEEDAAVLPADERDDIGYISFDIPEEHNPEEIIHHLDDVHKLMRIYFTTLAQQTDWSSYLPDEADEPLPEAEMLVALQETALSGIARWFDGAVDGIKKKIKGGVTYLDPENLPVVPLDTPQPM